MGKEETTQMRTMQLLENVEFHEREPNAEPLFVDQYGRVIRFCLKPGQVIREHSAGGSPFYAVVVKGSGIFVGAGGEERHVAPNTLLIFEPGEEHEVRAGDEELVFVGFLHGVPGTRPDHVGGELGRASQ
jgi:quercetin dioxygenase-like cupin family protein